MLTLKAAECFADNVLALAQDGNHEEAAIGEHSLWLDTLLTIAKDCLHEEHRRLAMNALRTCAIRFTTEEAPEIVADNGHALPSEARP